MNVSMHDSFNLAWKLAHVVQGKASAGLLKTYDEERRKVAHDLISFDHKFAKAFVVSSIYLSQRNHSAHFYQSGRRKRRGKYDGVIFRTDVPRTRIIHGRFGDPVQLQHLGNLYRLQDRSDWQGT
jgi:hypothetical protein